jgi:site-specific DNA recombinase
LFLHRRWARPGLCLCADQANAVPRLSSPPASDSDAVIYVRISDDKEGAGLGGQRQEKDCRSLAAQRGYRVVRVFSDNDTSAYQRNVVRPDYEDMMVQLRAGAFSTVIVWHLDRLWRKPRELEDMIELCESGERRVVSCYGDYDLSNPDGCFMARIVVAQANKESADKSRRLRRKMLELAEAGKWNGHPRAFGYDKAGMTVVPEEAALIREAAERVLAGEAVRSVCVDFYERGVRGVKGGPLGRTTLRQILQSARISGQREHRGVIVAKAEWPAIVTPETTQRLRALLRDPRRRKTGTRPQVRAERSAALLALRRKAHRSTTAW